MYTTAMMAPMAMAPRLKPAQKQQEETLIFSVVRVTAASERKSTLSLCVKGRC